MRFLFSFIELFVKRKLSFSPASSRVIPDERQDDDGPSKSQRKRDMHALQELGAQLPKLPKAMWGKLALPEILQDAVKEYTRITAFEGKRRQLQLLGKLMRRLDEATVQVLKLHFSEDRERFHVETARLHELEHWRNRLIKDDAVFTELCSKFPDIIRGDVHNLIRLSRGEPSARQAAAQKALYQALKNMFDGLS